MNMSKKTGKNFDTRKKNYPLPKRRVLEYSFRSISGCLLDYAFIIIPDYSTSTSGGHIIFQKSVYPDFLSMHDFCPILLTV